MVSSPPNPTITSAPGVPTRVSLPAVPMMVAGRPKHISRAACAGAAHSSEVPTVRMATSKPVPLRRPIPPPLRACRRRYKAHPPISHKRDEVDRKDYRDDKDQQGKVLPSTSSQRAHSRRTPATRQSIPEGRPHPTADLGPPLPSASRA